MPDAGAPGVGRTATGAAAPYPVIRKPPRDGSTWCVQRASPTAPSAVLRGTRATGGEMALPPQPWVARRAGPTRRRGAVAPRRTPAHSEGRLGALERWRARPTRSAATDMAREAVGPRRGVADAPAARRAHGLQASTWGLHRERQTGRMRGERRERRAGMLHPLAR